MAAPDFWGNQEKAREVVGELKGLKAVLKPLEEVLKAADNLAALVEMAQEDDDLAAEVPAELDRLQQSLEVMETKALLSGPLDANAALLTINARDGGTDANDWAEMLLRMYLNWEKDHDCETELLDRQDNEQACINSATIVVRGPMAYGYLKGESGIHRLVRISPFNAEGKRQTSFAAVDVSPEVSEQTDIEILDDDVEEQVFRASGPGGQHVNKTESAVRITHMPTGFVVACQDERSQQKNKTKAMRILRAKIFDFRRAQQEAEVAKNRKAQIGSGDRSGKIRTYNYPDNRLTDHRIGLTLHSLNQILDGKLDPVVEALAENEKVRLLTTL